MCPVRLLKLWYTRVYSEDLEQYVFARTAGALPRRRASFVRRLRLRLTAVAPRLGLDSSEFDPSNCAPFFPYLGTWSLGVPKKVPKYKIRLHSCKLLSGCPKYKIRLGVLI